MKGSFERGVYSLKGHIAFEGPNRVGRALKTSLNLEHWPRLNWGAYHGLEHCEHHKNACHVAYAGRLSLIIT